MDALRIDIQSLIASAQERLLSAPPHPIEYRDLKALEKNVLPPTLRHSQINIYALWKRSGPSGDWELMYIGQRSRKSGWSRVEQHLFSTPKGTQSKLREVRAAIEAGAQMGVTAILVEPDSLRLSIEEELINRNSTTDGHLLWNRKARSKASKRNGGDMASKMTMHKDELSPNKTQG